MTQVTTGEVVFLGKFGQTGFFLRLLHHDVVFLEGRIDWQAAGLPKARRVSRIGFCRVVFAPFAWDDTTSELGSCGDIRNT